MALYHAKMYNTDKLFCANFFLSEECSCAVCLITIQDVW
jgi:hypothetical protein